MNENKEPFYKKIYRKVENELGPMDTLIGIGLGVVVCGLYWSHCWRNH